MTYSLRVIIFAGNRPYFSHYVWILCWKSHTSKQKNPVSMTYGLRGIIIAGKGPYFSHYFQFLCWKTQTPVSTTYGFRVLCLIHSCGVITHCRVKQVYPLIKLHLWYKTGICGAVRGFAISFDSYFFKLTPQNEFLSQILVHFITSKWFEIFW